LVSRSGFLRSLRAQARRDWTLMDYRRAYAGLIIVRSYSESYVLLWTVPPGVKPPERSIHRNTRLNQADFLNPGFLRPLIFRHRLPSFLFLRKRVFFPLAFCLWGLNNRAQRRRGVSFYNN